ncbi:unnamed protein product [Bemisia tabaci]|uniref:Uncharacterized protein n=1 Tax=Bemisia tabaci TaxID=7038 RepID=A0A9P0A0B9_BEMTA|nr:unnamed protein product [Bemisia tabaci]
MAATLSTIFLDGMTTFLTKHAQYPEIQSLKDFEESDLYLQSGWSKAATEFYALEAFPGLRAKLVDSYQFYDMFISEEVSQIERFRLLMFYDDDPDSWNGSINDNVQYNYIKARESMRTVEEMDAFLTSVPQSVVSKGNAPLRYYLTRRVVNYHVVAESLITYPVLFTFLKNSFLFEKFNDVLARFIETGQTKSIFENMGKELKNITVTEQDTAPRPYNLRDLQPAFLVLNFGLFFGFLVFVSEIFVDYFQVSIYFKGLKVVHHSIHKVTCRLFHLSNNPAI